MAKTQNRWSSGCLCNWKECREWQAIFARHGDIRANNLQAGFHCHVAGPPYRKMFARYLLHDNEDDDTNDTDKNGDDNFWDELEEQESDDSENDVEESKKKKKRKKKQQSGPRQRKPRQQKPKLLVLAEGQSDESELVMDGKVARLHYTKEQCVLLSNMKRSSSGISHEQAVEISYNHQVDAIADRIPIQRVRDKKNHDGIIPERYYIIPSVPRTVVAAHVLDLMEHKFRNGTTSPQENDVLRHAAKIVASPEHVWKWRALFLQRKLQAEKKRSMNSRQRARDYRQQIQELQQKIKIQDEEYGQQIQVLQQKMKILDEECKATTRVPPQVPGAPTLPVTMPYNFYFPLSSGMGFPPLMMASNYRSNLPPGLPPQTATATATTAKTAAASTTLLQQDTQKEQEPNKQNAA
jgi:hypothetical protein